MLCFFSATYFNKNKRKIGRPPGGHTNLEGAAKKTGNKRKRHRKIILSLRKKHGPAGRIAVNGEQKEDEYEVGTLCDLKTILGLSYLCYEYEVGTLHDYVGTL